MNKIISPFVLFLFLIWTWQVVHVPSAIGFETHSGIQLKMMELIQSTLQLKKPDAQDLEIVKMWTSSLGENKVQAVFSYRFVEKAEDGESAQKTIDGEAVLYREPTEDPTLDKWVLQSVKSELESMNFTEGSVITGEDEQQPAEAAPATTDKKE